MNHSLDPKEDIIHQIFHDDEIDEFGFAKASSFILSSDGFSVNRTDIEPADTCVKRMRQARPERDVPGYLECLVGRIKEIPTDKLPSFDVIADPILDDPNFPDTPSHALVKPPSRNPKWKERMREAFGKSFRKVP